MLLPALILSVLAGSEPPPPPRIEVLEGRATLTVPSGVCQLLPGDRSPLVAGDTYLEVPGRSRVSVRWRATASLLIHGPATLEWGPGRDRTLLEWRVSEAAQIHLEVRRGPVLARLPGGWTATYEMGACYLSEGPGGSLDLHHDAGLPVHLVAPHDPEHVVPPVVVLAGARLRLIPGEREPLPLGSSRSRILEPYGRPTARHPDALVTERPWRGFAWPWSPAGVHAVEAARPLSPAPLSAERRPDAAPHDLRKDGGAPAPAAPTVDPDPGTRSGGPPAAAAERTPSPAPSTGAPKPARPEAHVEPPGAAHPEPSLDPRVVEVLRLLMVPPLFPGRGGTAAEKEGLDLRPRVRREGRLHLTPYGADWDDRN